MSPNRHCAPPRFRIRRRKCMALVGIVMCISPVAAFLPSFCSSHDSVGCTRLYADSSQQRSGRTAGPFSQLAATLPYWPPNRSSSNNNNNNRTTTTTTGWMNTMPEMSTSGLFFFLVVLYVLSSNEPVTLSTNSQGFEIALESSVESAGRNVLRAALPQTASDVVSVALGEGIAGVLGAVATLLLSLVLRLRAANNNSRSDLVREAVADGDYFLTRAAALPLLEAIGLSPLAASVASVILASVPSEVIKQLDGSRRMAQLKEEDLLMEELLQKQQGNKKRSPWKNANEERGKRFCRPKVVDTNQYGCTVSGRGGTLYGHYQMARVRCPKGGFEWSLTVEWSSPGFQCR